MVSINILLIILSFAEVAKSSFEGKTFSIRSRIRINTSANGEVADLAVHERYSSRQNTALITYENMRTLSKFEVYHRVGLDNVYLSLEGGKCRLEKADYFLWSRPSLSKDSNYELFVGPVRFLLLALKLKETQSVTSSKELGYYTKSFSYVSENENDFSFEIYFIQEFDDKSTPSRLKVSYNELNIDIQYLSIEYIHEDHPLVVSSLIQSDPFALQPLNGCSEVMDKEEVFAKQSSATAKFSFQAKVEQFQQDSVKPELVVLYNVTYSAQMSILRRDAKTLISSSGAMERIDRDLLDLESNILYNSIFRRQETPEGLKGLSDWCIATKASLIEENQRHPTLGELLAGADHFAYLGMAQVNGRSARMYQTRSHSIPLWMEELVKREIQQDHHIVLYIDSKLNILAIEIFKAENLMKQYRVIFNDFEWNSHELETFSFASFCTDKKQSLDSVEIEINLGNKQGVQSNTLNVESSRNQAILSGFLSNKIPISSIYELESKVLPETDIVRMSQCEFKYIIETKFKICQRNKNIAQFVGIGPRQLKQTDKIERFTVRNFEQCFFQASHLVRTEFGYDQEAKICFLGTFERVENPQQSSEIVSAYRVELAENKLGLKLNSSWFKGKTLTCQSPNGEHPFDLSVIDEVKGDGLRGFGLLDTDKRNKLLEIDPKNLNSWSGHLNPQFSDQQTKLQMNYVQCRTACFMDPDCQSFSVCIQDSQHRCITSRANFEFLTEQNTYNTPPWGSRLNVTLKNEETIELLKSRTCNIFFKKHLDLFEHQTRPRTRKFYNKLVYQVEDEEQCAELCWIRTVQVLRNNIVPKAKLVSLSKTLELDSLQNKLNQYKHSMEKMCTAILYADGVELANKKADKIGARTVKPNGSQNYCCLLIDIPTDNSGQKSEIERLAEKPKGDLDAEAEFQERLLDFRLFYERHTGFQLDSNLNETEQQMLSSIGYSSEFGTAEVDAIREMVERKDNYQVTQIVDDEAQCAKLCFTQKSSIWPACNSFDFLAPNEENKQSRCLLNSISLRYSRRQDLIVGVQDDRQTSHFEPLDGLFKKVHPSRPQEASQKPGPGNMSDKPAEGIAGFHVFCIVVVAIACGICIGKYASKRLVRSRTVTLSNQH